MGIFIDPNEPFEYRFKGHEGLGPVYIRPPRKADLKALGRITAALASGDPERAIPAAFDGAQLFLAGWELEEGGAPIPYQKDNRGRPTDETVSRLPLEFQTQIVAAVTDRAVITEDDAKN